MRSAGLSRSTEPVRLPRRPERYEGAGSAVIAGLWGG